MAKKIEIQGKALTVTDTDSGIIELSQPKKSIWYSEDALQNLSRISFYDSDGINGEFTYNPEIPHYQLSECIDPNDIAFTITSFREFCENFLGSNASFTVEESTGWAQYTDDQYTSGSPLVITEGNTTTLDINGATTIKSQLPTGVTDFYDVATSKILGVNNGDGFLFRINFKAFTSSPSGIAKIKLDIGGSQGVILPRAFTFPKGTGLANAQEYSSTNLYYTLGTFVANGGDLQVESFRGDTSIYDISLLIQRISKGR